MHEGVLTVTEAKRRMGVGHTKFYELLNSGQLKAKKCGKKTLVPSESVSDWLSSLPDYPAKNAEG